MPCSPAHPGVVPRRLLWWGLSCLTACALDAAIGTLNSHLDPGDR